jgi:5-methylcytosine-specific restriction enzyme A
MSEATVFEVGKLYHRQSDLHTRFGGNRQSGIAPCARYPYVFLFTAPTGELYGYRDGWRSDTEFSYTGEGQTGDMEMARGNRAIRNHEADGRELHLFQKSDKSGYYRYLGQFRYVSHQVQPAHDVDNLQRSAIVFRLERFPQDCERQENRSLRDER